MKENVLDHGYVELVETWGTDQSIVEAARMSTQKGFLGWGWSCKKCNLRLVKGGDGFSPANYIRGEQAECAHEPVPGDERLLQYLWNNKHATPFEMAGAVFQIKAPIFVFREWHRHRTQSYNEMSARYMPLPNENYIPPADRLRGNLDDKNKQAGAVAAYSGDAATAWLNNLENIYSLLESAYQAGLSAGVPKEVARVVLPVGRYSVMRASANLRNWIGFLMLRCDPHAQWEIRQYAGAVLNMLTYKFPRTFEIAREDILGAP